MEIKMNEGIEQVFYATVRFIKGNRNREPRTQTQGDTDRYI